MFVFVFTYVWPTEPEANIEWANKFQKCLKKNQETLGAIGSFKVHRLHRSPGGPARQKKQTVVSCFYLFSI